MQDNHNIEVGEVYNNRTTPQHTATVRAIADGYVVYVTASGRMLGATRAEFAEKYNVPELAFKPRHGQQFFFVSGRGEVDGKDFDEDDDDDTDSLAFGNYFRNEADAEVVLAMIRPIFRDANHG